MPSTASEPPCATPEPCAAPARYNPHRHPRSSHQQIARLLHRLRLHPILDVGAAQGSLGQMLQGSGLTMDAVEPCKPWAEQARSHYRHVFECAVEEAPLPQGHYGCVVCADVLEHLPDPVQALRRLQAAAIPAAHFVISLPNIAHLAPRLLLMGGFFPQMDKGPFDRTHLHFYTRGTALKLLQEAGLQCVALGTTPVPLEELWPAPWPPEPCHGLMAAQERLLKVLPTLFAYQWVMVARPA